MDKRELTALIRRRAGDLGFQGCEMARAEPIEGEELREWLLRGYHGTMSYLARNTEKRLDPRLILPGARSVICLALVYRQPESTPTRTKGQGLISKYARGVDYHELMRERLEELAGYIQELEPEAQAKIYVDTGPVLEKAWAVRAGLGWQGKNTNILNRRLGSWFFLGEILLDKELDYGEPVADHCGSCTRCIDACPTQALEPYLLDGRRCISYLTIEHREDIAPELRVPTGNLIYGCDICQDVCPWNRKAPFSSEDAFSVAPASSETQLTTLVRLTPEEFSERYRGSPIKRAKWRGWIRNAIVALGNSRDQDAIPELVRLLNGPDPMIRRHAAWALARIGTPEAFQELENRRTRENEPETVKNLEELLSRRESRQSFAPK
jgi:epoxyqueuosine reductase